jgi:hypothetical protein
MKRFTLTETGENLGTTFCGDNGRTLFQTEEEKRLMWSLDEEEDVTEDDGFVMTLKDFMDEVLGLHKCSKEELEKRGWGKRENSGLGFQTGVSNDGRLFTKR